MKKWVVVSCLLLVGFTAHAASTNLAFSAASMNRRLDVLVFTNKLISSAFTNANFTATDLSPYVGTNEAVVMLQFKGLAATTVSLRTYGDTNTVDATSMNGVVIGSGDTACMIVNTDTAGVVDIKATANTSMSLVWFLRKP